MNPALCMPLSAVSTGRSAVVRVIRAGPGLASRLSSMGLVPGVELHVHRNDRSGPVVIGVHGTRLVLGRGMADKLSVMEQDGDA